MRSNESYAPPYCTRSESLFARFLKEHNIQFNRIEEAATSRPDFLVTIGPTQLVFEIKERSGDYRSIKPMGKVGQGGHTVGAYLRSAIRAGSSQLRYATEQGFPSILLVYNNLDPLQMLETSDLDFQTAMYGELTISVGRNSGRRSEIYHGRNAMLRGNNNTHFGAVGRIYDLPGKVTVTLFENAHGHPKVPFEDLPPCFDVRRALIDNNPLSFT